MFWKRQGRLSAEAEVVRQLFGEVHAEAFEESRSHPTNKEMYNIYTLMYKIIHKIPEASQEFEIELKKEAQEILNYNHAEKVYVMRGYMALLSLLDRVSTVVQAMPKAKLPSMLKELHGGAPLFQCTPLESWSDFSSESKIDTYTLIWSWDHLCFVFLNSVISIYQANLDQKNDENSSILEPKAFRFTIAIQLAAFRNEMMRELPAEKPDEASLSALVGLQTLYEGYEGRKIVGLIEDLYRESERESILSLMNRRGSPELIPRICDKNTMTIPDLLQINSLIDLSISSTSKLGEILRDGISRQERLMYLANHDPIVPLCTSK